MWIASCPHCALLRGIEGAAQNYASQIDNSISNVIIVLGCEALRAPRRCAGAAIHHVAIVDLTKMRCDRAVIER
jgi:hypothetical protein